MIVLGIESSCDETACALVNENGVFYLPLFGHNMMNIAALVVLCRKSPLGRIWKKLTS